MVALPMVVRPLSVALAFRATRGLAIIALRGSVKRPPGRTPRDRGPIRGREAHRRAVSKPVRARRAGPRLHSRAAAHHAQPRPRAARLPAAAPIRGGVRNAIARPPKEPRA